MRRPRSSTLVKVTVQSSIGRINFGAMFMYCVHVSIEARKRQVNREGRKEFWEQPVKPNSSSDPVDASTFNLGVQGATAILVVLETRIKAIIVGINILFLFPYLCFIMFPYMFACDSLPYLDNMVIFGLLT